MMNLIFKDLFSDDKYSHFRIAILVILFGFAIRLFSFHYTYIINNDGVLYIHQARAIYYGLWNSVLNCSMGYLSNYSIFIVIAYKIFGDWVIAAKSVSLFFGTLTLVPLYFLLDRFFRKEITLLATLIFALIPFFIDRSVDVVRDPVYWFFSALGLYLFVSQIEKKNYLYLILSSLCFLMAAWARIEAILFLLASFIFIFFVRQNRKIERISIFAIPIVFLLLLSLSGFMILNMNLNNLHRANEITSKFSAPMIAYNALRANLAELMNQPLGDNLPAFLQKARNLVWLIALGTLIKYAITAYFYPFFLILIIGIGGIWGRLKEDRRILYLTCTAILALALLYMHTMHTWYIVHRFFAIFILPSFIFIGFGLEKVVFFFRSRFSLNKSIALSIVCLLILACSLPKNLRQNEADKVVFKEIGKLIAEREGNDEEILVAAPHLIRWISFYANVRYKGAPCPEKNYDIENIIGKNYGEFVKNLKSRGIKYFLWEEKYWPKESTYLINDGNMKDFIKLGTWDHPDTGNLILFMVM